MEICFENKKVSAFCEVYHQTKRVQESVESVVPDTNDDIGRIVSVQTEVLLKSKDVTSRGVSVSGEAAAVLLYITEGEDGVSFVRVSRAFNIDYEVTDADADIVSQISLSIVNSEARILNPRKVSVVFEISGELSCYREESVCIENSLPENESIALHTKYEQREIMLINAVCEKTFAVNEQFVFSAGKPAPERLVCCRAELNVSDTQMIGSKIIVKGTTDLNVCYMTAGECYPITTQFSAPFSQIIDTGRENTEGCTAYITLTSAYYDLIDNINGEKTLDAEIHAVTQAVSRCRSSVNYITDAYSNELPTQCRMEVRQHTTMSETQIIRLSKDERINTSEDCGDVLCILTSLNQVTQQQTKLSCTVSADVLYRTKSGNISAVRRILDADGECPAEGRILGARLGDVNMRLDGNAIDAHISVELSSTKCVYTEFSSVSSVMTDEDKPYDFEAFPALTLVKAENESVWELAKKYHSCVERISAMNDTENMQGKLLLIPKST